MACFRHKGGEKRAAELVFLLERLAKPTFSWTKEKKRPVKTHKDPIWEISYFYFRYSIRYQNGILNKFSAWFRFLVIIFIN